MGCNLSQYIILVALCSLGGLGSAFVPSQQHALSGAVSRCRDGHAMWEEYRTCHISSSSGSSTRRRIRSRPREAGAEAGAWRRCSSRRSTGSVRMMDTDMDVNTPSSSSTVTPTTASSSEASSTPLQFTNIDAGGEVDSYFLGELNFCLRSQDSVLSGPSITKALNTASNQMVKNLLILNSPEDTEPAIRDVQNIESTFESEYADSPQYPTAKAYLSCVCQLANEGCPSQETLEGLPEEYMMAFRRFAGVLADFGCIVSPGKAGRVRPADKDICLSILDYTIPEQEERPTQTRALNTLANRVVRTVCVGSDDDLRGLAREMEIKREKFMSKWIGGNWKGSQENSFYDALVTLVQNGLTDEPPALHGPYLNSFQRLMGVVVQEVGTRSTPASQMVLKSFFSWEREIRKELTEPAWESNPPDLVGSWALETGGRDGVTELPGNQGSEMEDMGLNDLVVAFRKDGTVQVPPEAGVGLQWRVEPGPTHLDTVYFEMIPANLEIQGSSDVGAGGGTSLSYTGYVDRGARIEARFSKRFVRMTGRLSTVVRGQQRPSMRFAMRLVARGEGQGLG